jgi:hypothetical protein
MRTHIDFDYAEVFPETDIEEQINYQWVTNIKKNSERIQELQQKFVLIETNYRRFKLYHKIECFAILLLVLVFGMITVIYF